MKKYRLLYATGISLVLVLAISACKSTPPAATTPPAESAAPAVTAPSASTQSVQPAAQPEVVAKPVDDALTALRDKAEALRTEGLKYGFDKLKSSDWAQAESARSAGLDAYGKDYDKSQKSFEDAIARYEAIRTASFASMTAELEASITAARADAVRAGADSYYPEQFALADDAVAKALSLKESGDLAGAYDAGQIALMRFRTLQLGMRAVELKTKISKNDFAQYDQENFDKAESKYAEATESYGSADAAAYEASSTSVTAYEAVNNAGFKVLCGELSPKVDDIRALCESIKAPKAAKAEYAEADAMYKAAHAYANDGKWEAAYQAGTDSLDAFSSVYQNVLLRRNAADAAMSSAKDKQAASTELARKADERIPLPANAEGYSEELPVLEESLPPADAAPADSVTSAPAETPAATPAETTSPAPVAAPAPDAAPAADASSAPAADPAPDAAVAPVSAASTADAAPQAPAPDAASATQEVTK